MACITKVDLPSNVAGTLLGRFSANLQQRILMCEKTCLCISLKRLCFPIFYYSFILSYALLRDNFEVYTYSLAFLVS